MFETLRDEHRRLLVSAEQLSAMISEPGPPDADRFARLRWSFTSQLMRHVSAEDRLIYAPLLREGRPVDPILANVDKPLLKLRDELEAHNRDWSADRACIAWGDYCIALRVLLDRMGERIRQEEDVLFPLIEFRSRTPYSGAA